ncbi:MAG TPA: trypsin-like peptidase domain-containing protein [Bacillota bacterium]|nr:trypsin-like peptidase domain-containing protein [Bacillota bacterium]
MYNKRWTYTISSILILIGVISIVYIYQSWTEKEIPITNPLVNQVTDDENELDLKTIIHEVEKSVIHVEAQSKDDTTTGSGFLYNNNGDVITNAHVVEDANVVYIRTASAQIYPAAIVAVGEETDIALLRVPQLADQGHLEFDENTEVDIGDEVIALGSPHGFQNTVTLGIISGKEREFTVDGYFYQNTYQISAQITHGNSGGPLIDRENGHVIGINSVGTDDGTIGFSIPLKDVIDKVDEWVNEIDEDSLEYASTSDIVQPYNDDQLIEDSKYLMDYFIDSINVRDYVTAYTLLSSSVQSNDSYKSFRDNYIHVTDAEIEDSSFEVNDDDVVEATVELVFTNHKDKKEHKLFTFHFGLENDQVKILKMSEAKKDKKDK